MPGYFPLYACFLLLIKLLTVLLFFPMFSMISLFCFSCVFLLPIHFPLFLCFSFFVSVPTKILTFFSHFSVYQFVELFWHLWGIISQWLFVFLGILKIGSSVFLPKNYVSINIIVEKKCILITKTNIIHCSEIGWCFREDPFLYFLYS